MKRLLVALIVCGMTVPGLAGSPRRPFPSIRPLQQANEDGTLINHCTTWALRVGQHTLWVTAAHCVSGPDGYPDPTVPYFIDHEPAYLHAANNDLDLADLVGPPAAGLTIASKPPKEGDRLHMFGYPYGFYEGFYFEGVLAHPGFQFPQFRNEMLFAIFHLPAAPGLSGSPVLDTKGRVVGVMQVALCNPAFSVYCSMSGGATLENLRTYLTGYLP